ncbi:MAG: hypothetical protein J7L23_03205 [Candidatus Diapherotrites archaeon]|nr:hypothetical protein [Candidatus Diapherotrites archaeon]
MEGTRRLKDIKKEQGRAFRERINRIGSLTRESKKPLERFVEHWYDSSSAPDKLICAINGHADMLVGKRIVEEKIKQASGTKKEQLKEIKKMFKDVIEDRESSEKLYTLYNNIIDKAPTLPSHYNSLVHSSPEEAKEYFKKHKDSIIKNLENLKEHLKENKDWYSKGKPADPMQADARMVISNYGGVNSVIKKLGKAIENLRKEDAHEKLEEFEGLHDLHGQIIFARSQLYLKRTKDKLNI